MHATPSTTTTDTIPADASTPTFTSAKLLDKIDVLMLRVVAFSILFSFTIASAILAINDVVNPTTSAGTLSAFFWLVLAIAGSTVSGGIAFVNLMRVIHLYGVKDLME